MQGEVLTRRDRRRRWSHEDKVAILKEAFAPGAVVADVARRHELRSQQIYQWRDVVLAERQGNVVGDVDRSTFVPVMVVPSVPDDGLCERPESVHRIEIVLIGGRILRAPSCVPCAEIKRLVRALEGA